MKTTSIQRDHERDTLIKFIFGEGEMKFRGSDLLDDIDTLEARCAEQSERIERLENQLAAGVHTCSVRCARPMCVARRRIEWQAAKLEWSESMLERAKGIMHFPTMYPDEHHEWIADLKKGPSDEK